MSSTASFSSYYCSLVRSRRAGSWTSQRTRSTGISSSWRGFRFMPSSISHREFTDEPGSPLRAVALWSGFLAGPVVWLMLLETNYAISYVACSSHQTWFLQAFTALALVAVAACGWWGWRTGSSAVSDRERWMARAGAGMSVFFLLVIASFEVPLVVLRPCV